MEIIARARAAAAKGKGHMHREKNIFIFSMILGAVMVALVSEI